MALKIEEALNDYRTANDGSHPQSRSFHGIRYAATRADVVAHSMGGLLTRVYISGVARGFTRRDKLERGWFFDEWVPQESSSYPPFGIDRFGTPSDGKVPYLRNDNFGGGSIRRFITVGSPFDGSQWAQWVCDNWNEWVEIQELAQAADALRNQPRRALDALIAAQQEPLVVFEFKPPTPTAVVDLAPDSTLQRLIEGRWFDPWAPPGHPPVPAHYPTDHKRVLWHPIVCVATSEVPAPIWRQAFWGALSAAPNIIANMPMGEINATNGDLLVTKESQANGQLTATNPTGSNIAPIPSHVHAAFPNMAAYGVTAETASPDVAQRARRLLYTQPRPEDWIGDLKP